MENEVRLIDANALNKRFDEREAEDIELYGVHIADCFPADEAKEIVDQMLTVDPEILRPRGRWRKRMNEKCCSVCRFIYYSNNDDFNYCPNCGAKMEG